MMKNLLLFSLLTISSMNAQELTFHPSQLNRGSESVTFKELAKELKDSGNKDLAHEFSRVHRRKTWSDLLVHDMGTTLFTSWFFLPQSNNKVTLYFKGGLGISGLSILLLDERRSKKTEKLAIEAVEKYNQLDLKED